MNDRRGNRRSVALIAGVVALGVGLAACSGGPGPTGEGPGASEPVELRMLVNITPVMTQSYYEDLVRPWVEEQDGVTVSVEQPSAEDVQVSLQQDLAAGDVPDIVASQLDAVVIPQLLPFPDEDWVHDTPLSDQSVVDGVVWQVATGAQAQSIVFYNTEAFDEAGIAEVPASLEEMTEAMRALKRTGYLPLQTAGEWVTGAQFQWFATPQLLAEGNFWAERTAGTHAFAGSAYETYLEEYATWIDEGLVASDALGFKYPDALEGFTSGSAAMLIMGNWVVPTLEADADFEIGVFAAPSIDGSPIPMATGPAQPYSVLRDTAHPELALSLVEYLVSDETALATALAAEGNLRPGVSYERSPLGDAVAAVLDSAPGLVLGAAGPDLLPGFGDEINRQVQSLYVGSSGRDAAEALDAWWDGNAGS